MNLCYKAHNRNVIWLLNFDSSRINCLCNRYFNILLIFVSDQISSHVIKPFVGRLRPCNEILIKDYVRLLANCSSGFSFPSSHATNHFALAFFLIVLFNKRYKWVFPVLFFWAFAISYSQVYVGVHYPLDILTGGFLGTIIGITFGMIPKNHLNLEI